MKSKKPNLEAEKKEMRLAAIREIQKNVLARIEFIRTKGLFFADNDALLDAEMLQLQEIILMLNRMYKKVEKYA